MHDSNKQVDYIIVGQGLAGSILAWSLLQEGKTVHLIDKAHEGAASAVAAGIINPITGRRFVKSWLFDGLLSEAQACYTLLEQQLNKRFFYSRSILRVLFNNKEENDFLARSALHDYANYIKDTTDLGNYQGHLHEHFSMGEMQGSAQLDIPVLIQYMTSFFQEKGLLTQEKFNYNKLDFPETGIVYKGINSKKIIFCEGQAARFNPFFNYLPFVPAKGEILIVKIEAAFEKILKHHTFLVPLSIPKHYWVGSTYEWYFEDEAPSPSNRQLLVERLEKAIKLPFEVVEHKAAIRPTVKDHRPFLGVHPKLPNTFIFNGFGTKGASLVPYWTKEFMAFLEQKKALAKEVDIARFL